jgi:DNA-binding transcriptional ArsR family regulator
LARFQGKILLLKKFGSLSILNHMVKYTRGASRAPLDATFGALADSTRRAILTRLAHGDATVTELASPFAVSLPAVSKHLRVLESAGLLQREIHGRIHRCRLAPQPMKDAAAWIETHRTFWETQFDALAKYLESTNENKEKTKWPPLKVVRTSRSRSAVRSQRRAKKSSPPGPSPNN